MCLKILSETGQTRGDGGDGCLSEKIDFVEIPCRRRAVAAAAAAAIELWRKRRRRRRRRRWREDEGGGITRKLD